MRDSTYKLGTYATRDEAEQAANRGQKLATELLRKLQHRVSYQFNVTHASRGWVTTVSGTREAIIHFQNSWRG